MSEDERAFFVLHRRTDRNRKRWARLMASGTCWGYKVNAGQVTVFFGSRRGHAYQAVSFEMLSDFRGGPRKLLAHLWRDVRHRLRNPE